MENANDHTSLCDERTASFTTSSDFARRLRSLLTPPRTRRSPNSSATPSCSSPTHVSRATIATSTPASRKSVLRWNTSKKNNLKQCKSCDDVRHLEKIFEPRMAPYTPPNNVLVRSESESNTQLEQDKLEQLESSLFEPRNAPCTPPLVRRQAGQDGNGEAITTSMDEDEVQEEMLTLEAVKETKSVSDDDAPSGKLTVERLQTILTDMRARAEESSAKAVQQIHDDTDGHAVAQPTVRQVQKIASVGNFQRSLSGRSFNRLLQLPRSRAVTVC